MFKHRLFILLPEHLKFQIHDELCGFTIKSVAVCFGHLGEKEEQSCEGGHQAEVVNLQTWLEEQHLL